MKLPTTDDIARLIRGPAAGARATVTWIRANPWFSAIYAVCSVMVLWPLWSVSYLPFLDIPQHMATISALTRYNDPNSGFSTYYALFPTINTYAAFYVGGAALAKLFGVHSAIRLLLSLYLVGTPAATARLLLVLRRSPWASIPAFAALYGWPLFAGFGAYVVGVPLAIWTIAEWIALADQSQPLSKKQWLGFAFLTAVLFFDHALAYGIALLIAFLAVCAFHLPKRWRQVARTIPPVLPSLALFSYWTGKHIFLSDDVQTLGASVVGANAYSNGTTQYTPLKQKIHEIPGWFAGGLRGSFTDQFTTLVEQVWLATVVLFALVAAIQWWRNRPAQRSLRTHLRPWILAVILAGLYFATPMMAANIWAISPRMIILGYVGLLLIIPQPRIASWAHGLLMLPWLALTFWSSHTNLQAFQKVDLQAKRLHEVLSQARPDRRLYGLMYNPYASGMQLSAFLHGGAAYMSQRGGLTGFTFISDTLITPLRLRVLGSAPYPGRRGEWLPGRFRYDIYGPFYDYFLSRGAGNLPSRIHAPADTLKQVARSGQWSLYENMAPRRTVAYSLDDNVFRASVSLVRADKTVACSSWKKGKLQCPEAAWTWVGPSEQTLGGIYMPCIWAHPPHPGEAIEIRYHGVPQADSLYGLAGVADTGQRPGRAPVRLQALLETSKKKAKLLDMTAGTRRGYEVFDVPLTENHKQALARGADVVLRVSTTNDAMRHFCFRATLFHNAQR